jgi:predicted ATP-grasp superfamily ATP-dependent carboligase
MSDLRFKDHPELRRPIVIAAFAGWSDAGEAATSSLRFMLRRWRLKPFADIDPEEYYDFTQARPIVRLEKGERVIDWPANQFSAYRREGEDHDVLLFHGIEPHTAWRSYVDCILEVCRQYDVSGFVMLGALLAEVSHARPVRVSGGATDDELARRLGLNASGGGRYQGPTGISGVLSHAIREAGIPSASIWANMPFYVQRSPNPKGALALLTRLNDGFDFDLTLHDLEVFAARFDAQVASDLQADPQVAEIVRRIEAMQDEEETPPAPRVEELPDAKSMVDALERFLRQQRREGGEQQP